MAIKFIGRRSTIVRVFLSLVTWLLLSSEAVSETIMDFDCTRTEIIGVRV